jgi:putative PIN family toxin of toxin-antitoxin system
VRVFLDTNVLVSAFATRGLCADVLRLVLAEHTLLTAPVVLQEVNRVLIRKFELPRQILDDIGAFLEEHTVRAKPQTPPAIKVRDADDLLVPAAALAAKAEVLVTGDTDLLEIRGRVPDMVITDPRGFWSMLTARTKE